MSFLIATLMMMGQGQDIYTSYPAFGDKDPFSYNNERVLAVTDKGLVRELIVQCTKQTEGIMFHDIASDTFCDSKNKCHKTLSRAISGTCSQ